MVLRLAGSTGGDERRDAGRESLLDHADLGALRAAAGRLDGPYATMAACLVTGGALEHDPGEPDWPDRDRVVSGIADGTAAVGAALTAAGHPRGGGVVVTPAWEALPRAVGLAAASRLDGGIFRTWCLLAPGAVDHGTTWEAARTAAVARLDTVVALVAASSATCAETVRILGAAGWQVVDAPADRPAELLGALDHALAAGAPAVVAAVTAVSERSERRHAVRVDR